MNLQDKLVVIQYTVWQKNIVKANKVPHDEGMLLSLCSSAKSVSWPLAQVLAYDGSPFQPLTAGQSPHGPATVLSKETNISFIRNVMKTS